MTTQTQISWRGWLLAAIVGLLACQPASAGPIRIVTLGDSLTDTYQGKPYGVGNQNWTDQLIARRAAELNITNLAHAGNTSVSMIVQQAPVGASLIKQGAARFATVMIGANDLSAFLIGLNPNNPASFDPTPF